MLSTIYKPTTQTREVIISESIDCNMMDTVNITNIIEEYTQITPLLKAWKRFCEEKSLPDISNLSYFAIIESIKGECPEEDNVFQRYRTPSEFIDYCDTPILKLLINEILSCIDFKFFVPELRNISHLVSSKGNPSFFIIPIESIKTIDTAGTNPS